MHREIIKEKILKILEENIGVSIEEETLLKEQGVDSLSLVSIIVNLEEVFCISFNEDDLEPDKLNSLSSLILLVEKYL